jgi:hypothetical protein
MYKPTLALSAPTWRSALLLWAALTLCPLWVGCGSSGDTAPLDAPTDHTGDDTGDDTADLTDTAQATDTTADAPDGVSPPLGVWAYLEARRAEVRQSPDHLPARAERLIADRDPEAIFAFVRDEIALLPAGEHHGYGWGDGDRARVGPRGVLRAGAGSPRDVADLLASMLTRAGYPAQVMTGAWAPADEAEARALWLRQVDAPTFAAPSPQAVEAARAAAGLGTPGALPPLVEAARGGHAAWVAALSDALTDDMGQGFDWGFIQPLPLVAFEDAGQTRYAHPFYPGAALGEPYGDPADLWHLSEVPGAPLVELTLNLHTARGDVRRVAEATWPLPEVVGRPISVGLAPALPVAQALTTAPHDVSLAVGVLALTRDAETPEGLVSAVVSAPFGLDGEQVTQHEGGDWVLGGVPLEAPAPGVDPASVASMRAQARASAFPVVEVSLQALDGEGRFVPGLGTDAFEVRDGGELRPWTLRRNTEAPRITVLYDTSMSMPFWVLDHMEEITAQIDAQLRALNPRAVVTLTPSGSYLWGSTLEAMRSRPDALIYLTDGDTYDSFDPRDAAVYAAGPAPLIVAVGFGVEYPETFDELIERTGGTLTLAYTQEDVIAQAVAYGADVEGGEYILSYRAPQGAQGERTVEVRTPQGVTATTTYTVPQPDARALVDMIIGVSLDVSIDGEISRRPLSGYTLSPGEGDLALPREAAAAYAEEVRQSLTDRAWLFVEGDALLPAVALDEHITGLLSARGAFEATDFTEEGLEALVNGGIDERPPELLAAFAPWTQPEGARVYAHRGRAALVRYRRQRVEGGPDAGALRMTRHLDLLPLRSLAAVGPDGGRARAEAVLEVSVERALMEASLYPRATANLLDPARLALYTRRDEQFADPDDPKVVLLAAILRRDWSSAAYVDVDGAAEAAWLVNRDTGEAFALLQDGSGGGEEEVAELRAIATALDITNQVAGLLGKATKGARAPLDQVLAFGKLIANSYGAAAILVSTLSIAWKDEEAQRVVLAAACEATKHLKGNPFKRGPEPLQLYTAAALTQIWGVRCD